MYKPTAASTTCRREEAIRDSSSAPSSDSRVLCCGARVLCCGARRLTDALLNTCARCHCLLPTTFWSIDRRLLPTAGWTTDPCRLGTRPSCLGTRPKNNNNARIMLTASAAWKLAAIGPAGQRSPIHAPTRLATPSGSRRKSCRGAGQSPIRSNRGTFTQLTQFRWPHTGNIQQIVHRGEGAVLVTPLDDSAREGGANPG